MPGLAPSVLPQLVRVRSKDGLFRFALEPSDDAALLIAKVRSRAAVYALCPRAPQLTAHVSCIRRSRRRPTPSRTRSPSPTSRAAAR
jgi:hypothetical protein